MTKFTRVLLVLTLLGCFIVATSHPSLEAQETQFSLAVGQWVTVGQYTLVFRGVAGNLPSYDLYIGSALAARFPSPALPSDQAVYAYGNVRIATTSVAFDGTAATGAITVR